jgi:hypothetical protein
LCDRADAGERAAGVGGDERPAPVGRDVAAALSQQQDHRFTCVYQRQRHQCRIGTPCSARTGDDHGAEADFSDREKPRQPPAGWPGGITHPQCPGEEFRRHRSIANPNAARVSPT